MRKILLLLLGLDLFFLQDYLIRFSLGSYPSNLQEIALGLTFLFFVLVKGPKRVVAAFFKHKILLTVALLTGFSLVAQPLLNTLDALRFVKFLFFAVLGVFVFLETYESDKQRMQGLKIFSFGALFFGLFSVVYNLLGFNVQHDARLSGPLDSAVYLAVYLVPAFLFFGFELLEANKKNLLRRALPFVVTGALLLATRSFGAIGAALLVSVFHLFRSAQVVFLKSKWFKLMMFVLVAGFGAALFYVKILPTLTTSYSSLDERGEIWQTTLWLLMAPKHFILGLGLGQFQTFYEQNVAAVLGREPLDYVVLQPHNLFLLFWVHFGLPGLALVSSVGLLLLWKLYQNQGASKSQQLALLVLLTFFIHGMIDTPLFKNDLLFLFLLFSELSLEKR